MHYGNGQGFYGSGKKISPLGVLNMRELFAQETQGVTFDI